MKTRLIEICCPVFFMLTGLGICAQENLSQGFIYLQNREYEQAETFFQRIIEKNPDHLDAGLGLAQAKIGLTRFEEAREVLSQMMKIYPDHPRIQMGLAQVSLALNNYREAIELFERARQQVPPNAVLDGSLALAYFGEGVQAYQRGQKNRAASDLRKSIELDSTNASAYQNLAICLLDRGDDEGAGKVIDRGLGAFPLHRELLLIKAKMLLRDKQFGQLVDIFELLYRSDPEDVDIGLKYAYFLRFQGRGGEAERIYSDLAEQYPSEKRVIDDWADYLVAGKNFDAARDRYGDFLNFYDDKAAIIDEIAAIYIKEGDFDSARATYARIFTYRPCDVATWKKIGQSYEQQDSLHLADRQYQQALSCARTESDSLELYGEIGRLNEDVDFTRAIDAYKRMIALKPDWDYPCVRLGLLYDQVGLDTTGIGYLRRAMFLDTRDPSVYYFLSLHHWDKGDTARARELALTAVHRGLDQRQAARNRILGKIQESDGQLSISEFEVIGSISQSVETMLPVLRMAIEHLIAISPEWQRRLLLENLWQKYTNDTVLPEYLGQILEEESLLTDAEFVYKNILKNNVRSKAAHAGLARIFEKQQKLDESILEYKRVVDIDEGDSTAYKALVRLHEQTGSIGKLEEEWRFKASINTRNEVLQHYLQAIQSGDGRKNPIVE